MLFQPARGSRPGVVSSARTGEPSRIASLMAEWVATGRCRYTIFNLKLPMKRRVEAVEQCRELIRKRLASVGPYDLRIKHLYHDREEVTAFLTLKR